MRNSRINNMKVYKLRLDSNNYQRFLLEDEGVWKTKRLTMDCTRKLPGWIPLVVYIPNPALKRGEFFHLCSGAFVTEDITISGNFEVAAARSASRAVDPRTK